MQGDGGKCGWLSLPSGAEVPVVDLYWPCQMEQELQAMGQRLTVALKMGEKNTALWSN